MKVTVSRALALAVVLGGWTTARAQQAPTAVQNEMLVWYDDAANKLVQLAEAIPAEQYSWRPMEGVRSVGEVVGHVTGGSYFLMGMAGAKAPEGAQQDFEHMTSKADLIRALQQSIEFTRAAMRGMTAADLDAPATIFGRQTTKREVCLLTLSHTHEHLGQLIAYARSNHVVPPWSQSGGE